VEQGADINKEDNRYGSTPLNRVCYIGNENIVKCLVDLGAYLNKEENNGWTPFRTVCFYGHENIVKYLVERG